MTFSSCFFSKSGDYFKLVTYKFATLLCIPESGCRVGMSNFFRLVLKEPCRQFTIVFILQGPRFEIFSGWCPDFLYYWSPSRPREINSEKMCTLPHEQYTHKVGKISLRKIHNLCSPKRPESLERFQYKGRLFYASLQIKSLNPLFWNVSEILNF